MAEVGSFKYVDPEKAFVVHPNVLLAYLQYKGNPDEFQQMMRDMKEGHNDDFDEYMRQIAADRTIAQAVLGWVFKGRK